MPFRIPRDYEAFSCWGNDQPAADIEKYIRWLRAELAVAAVALDQAREREKGKDGA
jgi:hypothetical protein